MDSLRVTLDTAKSQAVLMCYTSDHEALLAMGATASDYSGADAFARDYFITEYLSKYKGLETSYDLPAVALGKWRLAERQCYETNERFRSLKQSFHSAVEPVLHRAQRKIFKVLGRFEFSKVLASCRWGPGATFDLNRSEAFRDKKISGPISVTRCALPYLRAYIENDLHWCDVLLGQKPDGPVTLLPGNFTVVRGSRFLTVPKSAKTDRCIAAEPTGNSFLQQGVGRYLRSRLRKFGVDLDDQSRNQVLARDALKLGLATIDLSNASDTVSRELVYHLLPSEWSHYLDLIRSRETRVQGEWVRTEKFASMGNGFCFELESLIFWALVSSLDEDSRRVDLVSVYGDDLIIPVDLYEAAEVVLSFAGFTLNKKKSFASGLFRESCGKHFFNGCDVTPVYQKESLMSPSELIRAHNRLYRLFKRQWWPRPHKALKALRDAYPFPVLPRIPDWASGDDGFLTEDVRLMPYDPNRGYRCHVLVYSPRFEDCDEKAMLQDRMRTLNPSGDGTRRLQPVNPLPSGHCARPSMLGKWRTSVRYIALYSREAI